MTENKTKKVPLKNVMTREIFSVSPDTPLAEATKMITDHNFNGIPVVENGKLVGIITEYDIIIKTSGINISFLQEILRDIKGEEPEKEEPAEIKPVDMSKLTVKDIMNKDPLTLPETATFEDAVEAFSKHHRVNPIPVVNNDNEIVGIISRFDILRPLNLLGYKNKN